VSAAPVDERLDPVSAEMLERGPELDAARASAEFGRPRVGLAFRRLVPDEMGRFDAEDIVDRLGVAAGENCRVLGNVQPFVPVDAPGVGPFQSDNPMTRWRSISRRRCLNGSTGNCARRGQGRTSRPRRHRPSR
jgi:hypothetical protein